VQSNLLATKLYIPTPRPNYINRRRLLSRLDEILTNKLTLISAPAGFGKTTLVSIWVSESDHPVAWLSLDNDDNDPAIFLRYLIAGFQSIDPEIGHASLSILQSPQSPGLEASLAALINDLSLISHD
jgi:LuxR family maltose regulon positive regulatory protein